MSKAVRERLGKPKAYRSVLRQSRESCLDVAYQDELQASQNHHAQL